MGFREKLAGTWRVARRAGVSVVVIGAALFAASAAHAEQLNHKFNPTGAEQTFVVPTGVTQVHVFVRGGHGAGGAEAAEVSGELGVTAPEKLYIEVAGNGSGRSGGFNGGGEGAPGGAGGAPGQGGGGGTDVRTSPRSAGLSPDTRLVVAGGGGGGAGTGPLGGAAGQNGGSTYGGEAGTQSKGGEGGLVEECLLYQGRPGKEFPGSAGSLGIGGAGAGCVSAVNAGSASGGGGGGGYYGGGGGNADFEFEHHIDAAGGGGGGSSFVPAGATLALASASSEPVVEIAFESIGAAPSVITGAASAVAKTQASLNATVNPNGGEVSECKLEYGTSTAYGASAPCTPVPGSGTSPVAVSATVGGLTAHTTYHFRVVASNAGGTSYGSDEHFTTVPNAPTVSTEGARAATTTEAELTGSVNPNGGEVTACEFEYGKTTSYGSTAPCVPAPGSGTAFVSVAAHIGGLSAGTLYHVRLVATNVGGTGAGGDASFWTLPERAPPEFGRCIKIGGAGGYSTASCTAAQTGGLYGWYPAFLYQKPLEKRSVTLAIKPATKLTLEVKGGEKIVCTGQTGSGEYASTKSLSISPLVLTGCYKGVVSDPCENTAASGEIVTGKLVASLGILKESTEPAKVKVGLRLGPVVGETIAEFSCGSTSVTVNGSVILEGKANAMESVVTLKAAQAKGVQKWTHFVGGAANEDTLDVKIGGGAFTQSGLTLSSVQTNEEKVEANTIV